LMHVVQQKSVWVFLFEAVKRQKKVSEVYREDTSHINGVHT